MRNDVAESINNSCIQLHTKLYYFMQLTNAYTWPKRPTISCCLNLLRHCSQSIYLYCLMTSGCCSAAANGGIFQTAMDGPSKVPSTDILTRHIKLAN